MSIDEFWNIVERVHAASPSDMKTKCRLLEDELRLLPLEEVLSFERHFGESYRRAYTWDIWGAAHVIHDGCGDDSFMDFRSTLLSLGRGPFLAALADADSLAGFDIDPASATYEGYQYVAYRVYHDFYGYELASNPDATSHPREPSGVPFVAWEMSKRLPRLVAKYGYRDSDWSVEKEFAARLAKKEQLAAVVKTIMLNAGIIPSCGLIPPPRVVAQVLRAGRSPESSNRQLTWETFDWDEGYYWAAVAQLEKASLAELESRPDLHGVKLKLDLDAPGVSRFDEWMRTLRDRGLV